MNERTNGDVNVSYTFGTPKNATRQQLPTQLSQLKNIISHLVTSSRFSCLECGDLHKNFQAPFLAMHKAHKSTASTSYYTARGTAPTGVSVVDAESAKGERRTRDHRPQTRSGPPTLKKPEYVKEERAPSLLYTLPAAGQRKVEALSLSLSRKEGSRKGQSGRPPCPTRKGGGGRRSLWTEREGGKEVLSCSTCGLLKGRVC